MENQTEAGNKAAVLTANQQPSEYLSFRLGGEEYGIDILKVQEIRGYEASTRMMAAPSYVLGVLNLRGVIVPILDMRIKFGMADVVYGSQTVTIVLNIADRVVGMVVDAVSDVVKLSGEHIKPAPGFGSDAAADHIVGIATIEQADVQRMLILLDIEQLVGSVGMGLVATSIQ